MNAAPAMTADPTPTADSPTTRITKDRSGEMARIEDYRMTGENPRQKSRNEP